MQALHWEMALVTLAERYRVVIVRCEELVVPARTAGRPVECGHSVRLFPSELLQLYGNVTTWMMLKRMKCLRCGGRRAKLYGLEPRQP